MLRYLAVRCGKLGHVAVCCSALRSVAVRYGALQCVDACCGVSRYVAVRCGALRCVMLRYKRQTDSQTDMQTR